MSGRARRDGMDIRKRIQEETKIGLRAHDELRVSVLRMLLSAIHNREIEARAKAGSETTLGDEVLLQVIRSELKKRSDAITAYRTAGRSEAALKEEREAEILRTFLPPELSDGELTKLVREGKTALNASAEKDSGKLVGWVMQRVKGQSSGDRVMAIVKRELGSA